MKISWIELLWNPVSPLTVSVHSIRVYIVVDKHFDSDLGTFQACFIYCSTYYINQLKVETVLRIANRCIGRLCMGYIW